MSGVVRIYHKWGAGFELIQRASQSQFFSSGNVMHVLK